MPTDKGGTRPIIPGGPPNRQTAYPAPDPYAGQSTTGRFEPPPPKLSPKEAFAKGAKPKR
jgi:hypothetical protein